MPAVVFRQKNSVAFVIGGDDDAGPGSECNIRGDAFVVDAQYIRQCGDNCLHVVIEAKTIEVAEVAGFAKSQDDRSEITIEAAVKDGRGAFLLPVPRPDGALDGFEQAVFPDPLIPTEDDGVVKFFSGALHPVGEPVNDMLRLIGINGIDMIEPALGASGVAGVSRGGR